MDYVESESFLPESSCSDDSLDDGPDDGLDDGPDDELDDELNEPILPVDPLEVISKSEEIYDLLLDDVILDLCLDYHRAIKMGYLVGKLSILRSGTTVKKKKRTGPVVTCLKCKFPIGSTVYSKHLNTCMLKLVRNCRTVQRNPPRVQNESDDDLDAKKYEKERAYTRKKKKPKPKADENYGVNSKKDSKKKPRAKSTPAKRKPRAKAAKSKKITYPDFVKMTYDEKNTFLSKYCGVKLKRSIKETLCMLDVAACDKHRHEQFLIRCSDLGSPGGDDDDPYDSDY